MIDWWWRKCTTTAGRRCSGLCATCILSCSILIQTVKSKPCLMTMKKHYTILNFWRKKNSIFSTMNVYRIDQCNQISVFFKWASYTLHSQVHNSWSRLTPGAQRPSKDRFGSVLLTWLKCLPKCLKVRLGFYYWDCTIQVKSLFIK